MTINPLGRPSLMEFSLDLAYLHDKMSKLTIDVVAYRRLGAPRGIFIIPGARAPGGATPLMEGEKCDNLGEFGYQMTPKGRVQGPYQFELKSSQIVYKV